MSVCPSTNACESKSFIIILSVVISFIFRTAKSCRAMKPRGRPQGGQGAVKVEHRPLFRRSQCGTVRPSPDQQNRADEQYLDGSLADLKWPASKSRCRCPHFYLNNTGKRIAVVPCAGHRNEMERPASGESFTSGVIHLKKTKVFQACRLPSAEWNFD